MAATVVSVVIFLCGVLVGRGVRAERSTAEAAALSEAPVPDVRPQRLPPSAAMAAGSDPTAVAPPPAVDDLNAQKGPSRDNPPVEEVKPDRHGPAAKALPSAPPNQGTGAAASKEIKETAKAIGKAEEKPA